MSQGPRPRVFHAAFDFDTPGPWDTAHKSKNKEKTNLEKIKCFTFWPNHDLRLRICIIFHADSESDLKTSPNQVKNKILSKIRFLWYFDLKFPLRYSGPNFNYFFGFRYVINFFY